VCLCSYLLFHYILYFFEKLNDVCHYSRYYLIFFHKKTNQTEWNLELIAIEEVPCGSTTENGAIERTVDLPELRDIGRYVDVRITDDKFKYDLLKNPWLPSSNYNFPIVLKRKLKFQIS